jgi:hypothetical protein
MRITIEYQGCEWLLNQKLCTGKLFNIVADNNKLSEEVMAFVETAAAKKPALGPVALSELLKARFNISIHPRSLERARARHQKKRRR